jgi:hypothetical protein
MNIAFFPEGGELVAGILGRVYLQAKRPDGKPADISGSIVRVNNGKVIGKPITAVKTIHEGRGLFSFIPQSNSSYALQLEQPAGIDKLFPLPRVKASGAVLQTTKSVYPYSEKISVQVAASKDYDVAKITLNKREVELDSQLVNFAIATGKVARKLTMQLDPKDSEGVLIVTLWNKQGVPVAERLLYRQPKFTVNVALKVDGTMVPGGQVKVDILTTDENGKPVEAVVGLTVTDDTVLEMIDKREQAPRLPVMVYLENEVKELADSHIYLNADNAKSSEALDLLLGTQGWRRFVLVRYDAIKKLYPEQAKRILAEKIIIRPRPQVFQRGMLRVFKGKGLKHDIQAAVAVDAVNEVELVDRVADKKANIIPQPIPAPLVIQPEIKQEFNLAAAKMDMVRVKKIRFMPQRWIVVREYAHQVRANRQPNDRRDFSETLYWHAGIRTGARDGKATVKFALSDSVTTFRIMADAFGNNGALGRSDKVIKSLEPFYIEPKMPLVVTVGDTIKLPVALINSTAKTLSAVNLLVRGAGLEIIQAKATTLIAGQRGRSMVKIVAKQPGSYKLVLSASAGSYTDTVTKTLLVKPKGFPIALNHGGLIDAANPFTVKIDIPSQVERGSIVAVAKLYPTPLANMEEALNALLRQPNGCFEQTSSTNYPLVMAQQYFTTHQGIAPQKISKVRDLLQQGYKKLTGFECKKSGYEWFGGDPGHEALTAYGLMEFADMAKVMPVDKSMIKRTRQWLMERRDGQGGFKRNKRALDSFGRAPVPTTNAYIIWALLEAGEKPEKLQKEIAAIKKTALASQDSYVIALAANILYLSGDKISADKLAERLAKKVAKDGHITGGASSITRSGGNGLALETTSLTILAWLKDDAKWAAAVEKSMQWLFEQCKAGRFGSTQSTILVLKAINAYDKLRAKPKAPGTVQLVIDGTNFGHAVKFTPETKGSIALPNFVTKLTPGHHTLKLVMKDGSKMPFSIEIIYNTPLPASSVKCDLKLETKLSASEVVEGAPLEMLVKLTVGNQDAPTPIAIIGIPAGLEPRHAQLKELVAAGKISSYEVVGRSVILYWRALKADQSYSIPLSLTATIPGTYSAPASRSYLYYTDEYKAWVPGCKVKITGRI